MMRKSIYRIHGNYIPEWSLLKILSFTCTLYVNVFISYFLYTVQSFLHNLYNQAVTYNLTPMLQTLKKQNLFPRDEAASIEYNFYRIQFYLFISRFGFKSGICLLIAPVPVHCFSITFTE